VTEFEQNEKNEVKKKTVQHFNNHIKVNY